MPILQVKGLVKIYGRRRVVDGVDFEVEQGEIVGLLGPNGAGKTTSFRMACGMIEPDAGKVMLNDIDVTHWPMYRRARDGGMGYLAQEPSVFRKLSVENNLLGVMEMLGIDRKARLRRCDELLDQFDIARLRKSTAVSLSGGEKRRLEIARCLVSNPKIILLDEPFTGIDPVTIDSIQKIIRDLRERRHLDPDHRPPGARDAGDHRPQLRHPRRPSALPRHGGRSADQPRSPQVLLRRRPRAGRGVTRRACATAGLSHYCPVEFFGVRFNNVCSFEVTSENAHTTSTWSVTIEAFVSRFSQRSSCMFAGQLIFARLMDFFPRHEFNACVRRYRGDYRLREIFPVAISFWRWPSPS